MSGVRSALAGLTTRGRCLLGTGLVLVVGAVVLGHRDLLRAAVLLVVLPLAAVAVVSRTRYRLACTRRLEPARVEAGGTASVRLHLENVSRLPTGLLLMEDALPWSLGGRPRFVLDKVEPQGARDVTYPVSSPVRGRFPVGPLSVQLADPFGLCRLTRSFATVEELLVTPVVTPLPPVRVGGDRAGGDAGGRAAASSGTDDAAVREYRHGDALRRVHWRSTARVGGLMVRREEQPLQSRATLLLDGRSTAHHGDGPASSFEWAVSAVASVGAALGRAGFGLTLLHETGQLLGPSGRPLTPVTLLEVLASVQTTRTRRLDAAVNQLRQRAHDGLVVAVLGDLDPADAERLAGLRPGALGCVAVLVDTDTWRGSAPSVRTAAAARHEATADVLGAAGWRVLPVSHGTTLASVWPLAAARGAAGAPRRPVPAGEPVAR